MEDEVVNLEHVATKKQLVVIFTKAFIVIQSQRLMGALGVFICDILYKLKPGRRTRRPSKCISPMLYGAHEMRLIIPFKTLFYLVLHYKQGYYSYLSHLDSVDCSLSLFS